MDTSFFSVRSFLIHRNSLSNFLQFTASPRRHFHPLGGGSSSIPLPWLVPRAVMDFYNDMK
jgi:hypothetical protein